jgi:hypothetical protein
MGRQFVPVGMGMGIMPGRKDRFWQRVMGRVGLRMDHGVVFGILIVTLLIITGV